MAKQLQPIFGDFKLLPRFTQTELEIDENYGTGAYAFYQPGMHPKFQLIDYLSERCIDPCSEEIPDIIHSFSRQYIIDLENTVGTWIWRLDDLSSLLRSEYALNVLPYALEPVMVDKTFGEIHVNPFFLKGIQ